MMRRSVLVAVLAGVVPVVAIADTPRDPAFNGGRPAQLAIGTGATLNALAPAPDGGFAATGTAVVNGREQTFVARRDATGAPTTAFAGSGQALATFGDSVDASRRATAVAVEPDGHVLTAGVAGGRLFVARYAADGTLDPRFGAGGVAFTTTFDFGADFEPAAIVTRPDGHVLVAGSVPTSLGRSVLVAAFTDIGGIDATFGTQGFVVQQAGKRGSGTPADSAAKALALDAAGTLTVAGTRSDRQGRARALILKLDPAGVPLRTRDAADTLPGARAINAIRLEPDGSITLAGTATDGLGNPAGLVARLGPTGGRQWSRVTQLGLPTRTAAARSTLQALGADGLVAGQAARRTVALRVDDTGRVACGDRTVAARSDGPATAAGNVVGTTREGVPTFVGLAALAQQTIRPRAVTGPVIKRGSHRRVLTGVVEPGCGDARAFFVAKGKRVAAGRVKASAGPQTVSAVVKRAIRSRDRRQTTHVVRQSWLARYWMVPYHTGWHLAHHVDMGVPWTNLPRLHAELVDSGWVTPEIEYPTYRAFWRTASSGVDSSGLTPPAT